MNNVASMGNQFLIFHDNATAPSALVKMSKTNGIVTLKDTTTTLSWNIMNQLPSHNPEQKTQLHLKSCNFRNPDNNFIRIENCWTKNT